MSSNQSNSPSSAVEQSRVALQGLSISSSHTQGTATTSEYDIDALTQGILECSLRPSDLAHLPAKDQIFYTKDRKPVNINGEGLKYKEFLAGPSSQPECGNCGTTVESVNNWRKWNGAWMCNPCGAYPKTHNLEMRPAHLWKNKVRPRNKKSTGPAADARVLYPATQNTLSLIQQGGLGIQLADQPQSEHGGASDQQPLAVYNDHICTVCGDLMESSDGYVNVCDTCQAYLDTSHDGGAGPSRDDADEAERMEYGY